MRSRAGAGQRDAGLVPLWALVVALAGDAGCGGRSGLEVWPAERNAGGVPGGGGSGVTGGRAATGGTGTGGRGGTGSGGASGSVGTGGSMSQGGIGAESGRAGAGADAGRIGMAGVAGASGSAGAAGAGGSVGTSGAAGSAGTAGDGGVGGEAGSPPDAIALALGAFHTCAGFDNGSLRCWGGPGYIGSGTEVMIGDDETPSVIPPVEIGGDVRAIAAGWYHTCAVLPLGNVRCFGVAADGRLGYANSEDIGDDEAPSVAGDVDLGGAVSQLSVGPWHSCASLQNGAVRCWGENSNYQLGYPDPATIGDDESPAAAGDVDVGGLVLEVVVGGYHSCALLEGGTVRCWGQGSGGRLGYGNTEVIGDDERPRDAGDIDLGGQAVQLAAGLLHTCALLSTGNVRCWGPAAYGVLGYANLDTIGDDETPAQAGDVDVGGTVLQIAAGDFATCALLEGGAVRCWGKAEEGELGYGNLEDIGDNETPASAGDVRMWP